MTFAPFCIGSLHPRWHIALPLQYENTSSLITWTKCNSQIKHVGEILRYLVFQHVDQVVTTVIRRTTTSACKDKSNHLSKVSSLQPFSLPGWSCWNKAWNSLQQVESRLPFSPRICRTWLNAGNIRRNGCWRLWKAKRCCAINHQTKIKPKDLRLEGDKGKVRGRRKSGRGGKRHGQSTLKKLSTEQHAKTGTYSFGIQNHNCILFINFISKPVTLHSTNSVIF